MEQWWACNVIYRWMDDILMDRRSVGKHILRFDVVWNDKVRILRCLLTFDGFGVGLFASGHGFLCWRHEAGRASADTNLSTRVRMLWLICLGWIGTTNAGNGSTEHSCCYLSSIGETTKSAASSSGIWSLVSAVLRLNTRSRLITSQDDNDSNFFYRFLQFLQWFFVRSMIWLGEMMHRFSIFIVIAWLFCYLSEFACTRAWCIW